MLLLFFANIVFIYLNNSQQTNYILKNKKNAKFSGPPISVLAVQTRPTEKTSLAVKNKFLFWINKGQLCCFTGNNIRNRRTNFSKKPQAA